MSESLAVTAGGASETGPARSNNEDAWLVDVADGLFVVADGLGGEQAGELASQLAVDTIREDWQRPATPAPQSLTDTAELSATAWRIRRAVEAANRTVRQAAAAEAGRRGMGAAVVVAAVSEDRLAIGHAGDCRAYLVRDGQAQPLTDDHSLAAQLVRGGQLTAEAAQHHPLRNRLVNCVGLDTVVIVPWQELPLRPGDAVVLCCDGLWEVLEPERLARLVALAASAPAAARDLVRAAVSAPAQDNVTAVVIRIGGTPSAPEPEQSVDLELSAAAGEAVEEA